MPMNENIEKRKIMSDAEYSGEELWEIFNDAPETRDYWAEGVIEKVENDMLEHILWIVEFTNREAICLAQGYENGIDKKKKLLPLLQKKIDEHFSSNSDADIFIAKIYQAIVDLYYTKMRKKNIYGEGLREFEKDYNR